MKKFDIDDKVSFTNDNEDFVGYIKAISIYISKEKTIVTYSIKCGTKTFSIDESLLLKC